MKVHEFVQYLLMIRPMTNQNVKTVDQISSHLHFSQLSLKKFPCQTILASPSKSSYRFGQWSSNEQQKYFQFLFHNRMLFKSKVLRKSSKIFKRMFRFIKTRNPCQCRTHHQNVMRKFKRNVDLAIQSHYQENLKFFQKYAKVKPKLEVLEDDWEFYDDYQISKRDYIKNQENQQKTILTFSNKVIKNSVDQGPQKSTKEIKLQNITYPCTDIMPQTQLNNFKFKKVSNTDENNEINQDQNQNIKYTYQNYRMLKVMECHYLYSAWMEKLSMLINFTN